MTDTDDGTFSDGSIDFSEDEASVFSDTLEELADDINTPIIPDVKYEMPVDKAKKEKEPLYKQKCSKEQIDDYLGKYTCNNILEFEHSLKKDLLKKEQTLELVEGVTKCNKCKSNKVYTYQMQTRSGDEAMTTFYVCSVCAAKWKT